MSRTIGFDLARARTRVDALEADLLQARRALASLEELATVPPGPALWGHQKYVTEVNGVELALGAKQAAVIDVLRQIDDYETCVPTAVLRDIFGGTKGNMSSSLIKLRAKLRRANCDLAYIHGRGYRMQDMQATP